MSRFGNPGRSYFRGNTLGGLNDVLTATQIDDLLRDDDVTDPMFEGIANAANAEMVFVLKTDLEFAIQDERVTIGAAA